MTVIKHPAIHVSVPKLVKILPPCRLMLLPLNQVVLPAALPRLLLPALIVMTVMLNPAALVSPNLVTAIHFHTARQELQVALDVNPVPPQSIKSTAVRAVIRHLAVPVWLPAARTAILPARLPVVPDITYQQAAIPAVNLAENALPIPAPVIHFPPAQATAAVLPARLVQPPININLIPAMWVTPNPEIPVWPLPAPVIHSLTARVTVNVLPANPDLLPNINLIPVKTVIPWPIQKTNAAPTPVQIIR